MSNTTTRPAVAVCMGSQSDWTTMQEAAQMLEMLDVPYETKIISAHRTPDRLAAFARGAADAGFGVIIAGAGGAAHLPGMTAAMPCLPVIAVPVSSRQLNGLDSLLSIVQMPRGVAVATQAIGAAGAFNAGLMAGQILALQDAELRSRLQAWRAEQTQSVPEEVE